MPLFNIGFVIFPDLTQLDFTGPTGTLAASSIGDPHCREIGGARSDRCTWPRADAHLCELSASRPDLHTRRKRRRGGYYQ